MQQEFLTVKKLIEQLSECDPDKIVAYIDMDYGITPIVGISDSNEYVFIDGVC